MWYCGVRDQYATQDSSYSQSQKKDAPVRPSQLSYVEWPGAWTIVLPDSSLEKDLVGKIFRQEKLQREGCLWPRSATAFKQQKYVVIGGGIKRSSNLNVANGTVTKSAHFVMLDLWLVDLTPNTGTSKPAVSLTLVWWSSLPIECQVVVFEAYLPIQESFFFGQDNMDATGNHIA